MPPPPRRPPRPRPRPRPRRATPLPGSGWWRGREGHGRAGPRARGTGSRGRRTKEDRAGPGSRRAGRGRAHPPGRTPPAGPGLLSPPPRCRRRARWSAGRGSCGFGGPVSEKRSGAAQARGPPRPSPRASPGRAASRAGSRVPGPPARPRVSPCPPAGRTPASGGLGGLRGRAGRAGSPCVWSLGGRVSTGGAAARMTAGALPSFCLGEARTVREFDYTFGGWSAKSRDDRWERSPEPGPAARAASAGESGRRAGPGSSRAKVCGARSSASRWPPAGRAARRGARPPRGARGTRAKSGNAVARSAFSASIPENCVKKRNAVGCAGEEQ